MRKFTWLLALAIPVTIISCQKDAVQAPSNQEDAALVQATGNGAPSGSHYTLNIIGVPKDKQADMTGNSGHRIFVPLWGNGTRIDLTEGDFQVLDANGTDGRAAFQLPNPDPDGDGKTWYSVYARALGTPGGSAEMTTCLEDKVTKETYCSEYSAVMTRNTGKSTFTNVSKELLFVYYDFDGDGTLERVGLFSDDAYDYYWNYDNAGLKVAQLRFYEEVTDVNTL